MIVYDNRENCVNYANGVVEEVYKGFIAEENERGDVFILYEDSDNKRSFVLPKKENLNTFKKIYDKLSNYFNKRERLDEYYEEVRNLIKFVDQPAPDKIKQITDQIYQEPQNYVEFVAMNFTKGQFAKFILNKMGLN